MSIWLFIWGIFSIALLSFAAWTVWVVLKQKKVWGSFARQNKLRYSASALFTSPKVSGIYKGYSIAMFPCEHETPDARGVRKLTAVELELESRFPVSGAVGTGGMVPLIQGMEFSDEIQPNQKFWDTSYIIRTEEKQVLKRYLTPERLKALAKLAKTKNAWMIFIFRGNDTILRIDTPDPLESSKKIQALLQRMIEVSKILELDSGEKHALMKPQTTKGGARVLSVDTSESKPSVGLELEEEPSSAEEEKEKEGKKNPDEEET